MRRLSKEQRKERDRIVGELEVAQLKLQDAIDAYMAKVADAQAFCASVVDDIDSYMSDKSDTWQEGDRGQAYEDWKSSWEEVEFPEIRPPFSSGIHGSEEGEEKASDVLSNLDEEPSA